MSDYTVTVSSAPSSVSFRDESNPSEAENAVLTHEEVGPGTLLAGAAQRVKRLALRTNFAWTVVANACSAASAWLIVVAIAKLGSMEMAGHYALAQAIVIPVLSLSMLQLRAVFATDAANTYQFGHYLGLRAITTTLAVMAIAWLAFASNSGQSIGVLVLAVGAGAAIESLSDVVYGALQQRERMDWIAISIVCRSVLGLAVIVFALRTTGNLATAMFAGAAAKTLIFSVVDVPLAGWTLSTVDLEAGPAGVDRLLGQLRNFAAIGKLAWLSLPLGLVMLILALQSNLPRYLIERWLDSKQLGLFAALNYAAIAGSIVVNALAQSAAPRLAQHYLRKDAPGFTRLLAKLAVIGGLLGVGGVALSVLFGRPFLALLYTPEYAERNDLFVWLMAAAGVSYVATFLGWGMTAARRLRIQLPLFTSIVIAMFAAGCVLVPRYGLVGAAATVLIGSFAQLAGSLFVVVCAVRATARPEDGELVSMETSL
jgi:O-antigen/teichoic acid export membrane protein